MARADLVCRDLGLDSGCWTKREEALTEVRRVPGLYVYSPSRARQQERERRADDRKKGFAIVRVE